MLKSYLSGMWTWLVMSSEKHLYRNERLFFLKSFKSPRKYFYSKSNIIKIKFVMLSVKSVLGQWNNRIFEIHLGISEQVLL